MTDAFVWMKPRIPKALSGLACVGVAATGLLSARAVPKVQDAIAEAAVRKSDEAESAEILELTWQERVKAAWRPCVPPIACGITTCAAIIGSNTISARELAAANAAVAGGYLIEQSLDSLKEEVIERFGPQAYDDIRNSQAEKHFSNTDVDGSMDIHDGASMKHAYATNWSGNDITYHTESEILDIERKIIRWVESGEYVSVNDILIELGFRPIDGRGGQEYGYDKQFTGIFEFDMGHCIRNGIPCHYIILDPTPRNYYRC